MNPTFYRQIIVGIHSMGGFFKPFYFLSQKFPLILLQIIA